MPQKILLLFRRRGDRTTSYTSYTVRNVLCVCFVSSIAAAATTTITIVIRFRKLNIFGARKQCFSSPTPTPTLSMWRIRFVRMAQHSYGHARLQSVRHSQTHTEHFSWHCIHTLQEGKGSVVLRDHISSQLMLDEPCERYLHKNIQTKTNNSPFSIFLVSQNIFHFFDFVNHTRLRFMFNVL